MVLLAANELPQSSDYTTGLSRRRLTVRMDKQIDVLKRRDLIEISGESINGDFAPFIPGLLNWVLELDHSEVSQIIKGYSKLATVKNSQADILIETNPIAAWVDYCVVLEPGEKTYVGSAIPDRSQGAESRYLHIEKWLYASYRNFSESHGTKPVSANRFSPVLFDLLKNKLKLDIKKYRDFKGSYFENIRLRYESDTTPPLITDITDMTVMTAMTANLTANLTAETPTHDELDGLDGLSEKSVKILQSGDEKNSITDNGLGGEFSQKSVINPQVRHTGGFQPSGEPSGSHQVAIINDCITDFDTLDVGDVLIAEFKKLHIITARNGQQWLTHRGEYVSRADLQNQVFKVPTVEEMITAIGIVYGHGDIETAHLLIERFNNDPKSLFCQAIAADSQLNLIYTL